MARVFICIDVEEGEKNAKINAAKRVNVKKIMRFCLPEEVILNEEQTTDDDKLKILESESCLFLRNLQSSTNAFRVINFSINLLRYMMMQLIESNWRLFFYFQSLNLIKKSHWTTSTHGSYSI